MKQGMTKRIITVLLCAAMTATLITGCSNKEPVPDSATPPMESPQVPNSATTPTESPQAADSALPQAGGPVESATVEQVHNYMNNAAENTVLVDARSQEAYSGWALEGAANGGHLQNAVLFSARWLDCDYSGSAPREAYLERAMT